MNSDYEQSKGLSTAQLEQLLKLAYDAPEPGAAFVNTLSAKLDHEFLQSLEVPTRCERGQSPSSNGASQVGIAGQVGRAGPVSKAGKCTENTASRTLQAKRKSMPRRIMGRLAMFLATSASLLVAISLWDSSPAYGWAVMIRALEQCTWVQTVATSHGANEGHGINGWASASRGVLAVQSGNRTVFRDDRQAMGAEYRADEHTIYQQSLASRQPSDWETRLLVLLLIKAGEIETILNSASHGWELVSDTWKQVEGKDGHDQLIELHVKLKSLKAGGKTVELEFLLDTQTNLPISGSVLHKDRVNDTAFNFAYPKQGPTTIFALGVPKETKWVALSATGELDSAESEKKVLSGITDDPDTKLQSALIDADSAHSPHAIFHWTVPIEPLALELLVEQLNTLLTTYWESQGVHPTEPATDTEFLRRVYLDLTGRIPMVSEVYQFLENNSSDRRVQLVEELFAGRDHATHLAAVWRSMLLPDGVDLRTLGGTAKFDGWLADRFGQNLSYGQLVSQLLSAEGRVSEPGPLLFYAALKLNPEELAAKTARVFLGTRMECAQCHDHPFDDQISQTDFWGFAAYFAQISRPKGKMETTSKVLLVRDNARGEVVLPDTDEVIAPHLPDAVQGNPVAQGDDPLSRRQQLVAWLTSQNNRRFAAATVNRVWAHLFGRGLVDPVDDLRRNNPPAVPEVLELLSRDFAASGFDLRRLMKTLVLSDAYQLSSRADVDELSQTLLFARMNMKSMTADQLYDCIAVATQNEAMLTDSNHDGALARINNTSRQAFITQFRSPPGQRTDYHAGIPQALTLLYGQIIHGATDISSSGLLKSLAAPFFSDEQRVETLFLATLSRQPEKEERQLMLEHVRAAKDAELRMQAMGDVLWALLNSAEFTFNH